MISKWHFWVTVLAGTCEAAANVLPKGSTASNVLHGVWAFLSFLAYNGALREPTSNKKLELP